MYYSSGFEYEQVEAVSRLTRINRDSESKAEAASTVTASRSAQGAASSTAPVTDGPAANSGPEAPSQPGSTMPAALLGGLEEPHGRRRSGRSSPYPSPGGCPPLCSSAFLPEYLRSRRQSVTILMLPDSERCQFSLISIRPPRGARAGSPESRAAARAGNLGPTADSDDMKRPGSGVSAPQPACASLWRALRGLRPLGADRAPSSGDD